MDDVHLVAISDRIYYHSHIGSTLKYVYLTYAYVKLRR